MGEADFAKALAKDPGLIARLQKHKENEAFRREYNVERATPLKCPSCAAYLQSPGSLWYSPLIPHRLVCKKCKLVFELRSLTVPNETLIEELREVVKGQGTLPSWLKIKEEPSEELSKDSS